LDFFQPYQQAIAALDVTHAHSHTHALLNLVLSHGALWQCARPWPALAASRVSRTMALRRHDMLTAQTAHQSQHNSETERIHIRSSIRPPSPPRDPRCRLLRLSPPRSAHPARCAERMVFLEALFHTKLLRRPCAKGRLWEERAGRRKEAWRPGRSAPDTSCTRTQWEG
jgi:hypothetical protein